MQRRSPGAAAAVALLAVTVMSCGDDDAAGSTTTSAVSATSTKPGTAPEVSSFSVTSPVTCDGTKATVKVAYTSQGVETFTIKIGTGPFEKTVGFEPKMDDAIAEIPCTGAAQSTVQLRGCGADDQCARSPVAPVSIVAPTTTTRRATTTTTHPATTTTTPRSTTTHAATTTTHAATTTTSSATTTTEAG